MSNPRPESRIKSLETRVTDIEAGIEELASDQAEGLRIIRQDIKKLDEGIKLSYGAIGDALQRGFDNVASINTRLDGIEKRLDTMATKDDIERIEETQERQEQILQAILDRLPAKRQDS